VGWARAGLLLAVLAAWQFASQGGPAYLLGPLEILKDFWAALGSAEIYEHIGASLARSLPGFALGSAAGVALGLAAAVAPWAEPRGLPLVPGAEDRHAADLHAVVRHRRPVEDPDHRARLLLPGVHQRLHRREADAHHPRMVGAEHGRRARADLSLGRASERGA